MPPSPVPSPVRLACLALALAMLGAGSLGRRTAPPLRATDTVSVQVTGTVVNLRAGPGLTHAVRGQVRQETVLTVQGRSADDAWLAVTAPGSGAGARWIYADLTDIGARRYALPWAGPPALCARSADIRAALRAAWAAQDQARPCAEATWADLAGLTALPPGADDRLWLWEPHDLAGLTGLRAARVVVTDAYAAAGGRLSGLAGLERLDLQSACCAGHPWPDHFLAGAARLQALTVEAGQLATLPNGFLAHTPQLHTLYLDARALAALPADFLAHAPQLQHLTLRAPHHLAALPETFLTNAPQLHTLDLDARALAALPADFLAHAPQLQHLTLHAPHLAALPETFLANAPQLHTLYLDAPAALPETFLANAPRLHTLYLDAPALAALPETFLANAPQLHTLDLDARALAALPETFLAHAPQLHTLDLDARALAALPETFLAHAPQLHTLTLNDAYNLAALPADFLAHAPQLQHLTLHALLHLAALPETFLAHAPQLQHLTLHALLHLAALPETFLAHAPQLHTLDLDARALTALPVDFLAHAPQLQHLTLHAPHHLAALPETFLAHAPQLQALDLDVSRATTWPVGPPRDNACLSALTLKTGFWPASLLQAHAPCLRQLDLWLHPGYASRPSDGLPALPQLQTLDLTLNHDPWPLGLVAHAPRLRTLALNAASVTVPLPRDFLASAPQLQTLTLRLPTAPHRLPAQTLAEAPQLTQFRLQAPGLHELPRGFLGHAPRLRRLEIDAWDVYAWPAGFLARAPQLETLILTTERFASIPAGFLARAPRLQRLSLNLFADASQPDDFLAHVPALQHLTLGLKGNWIGDADNLAAAPDAFRAEGDFLAHAPRLQRLELGLELYAGADGATGLPARFLAHVVPRLQHLDLDLTVYGYAQANGSRIAPLPAGFLARAPRLQRLDMILRVSRWMRGEDIERDATAVEQHDIALPAGFLAHAPQLRTLNLHAPRFAALPDDFLAHAPRLTALDWRFPALTTLGDRVLARAPALEMFALDAPRLAAVGTDFLAHAPRLQRLTLLTEAPAPLRLGARFLARAPQVRTVRIGATAAPDAQTDLGAAALAVPADFLADLPRLQTVELLTPLRDPPPPGFLRGTAPRTLRLRVRIAADAQGAPRLPARVQAAVWRLDLTCDSAYPDAWLAPLAAHPPAALTVAPCHDEGQRWHNNRPGEAPPPRLPRAALRTWLADAPGATRLQVADYAQLAPADYAHLPVRHLSILSQAPFFTGEDARAQWRQIDPGAVIVDDLALHRAAAALETLHLHIRFPLAVAPRPLAAALAAPAFLLDFNRYPDFTLAAALAPLLRAPPAPIQHLGVRVPLAGALAATFQDLDFACLQLVLPALHTPPSAQMRAAARRHGLDLRLVAGFAPERLTVQPLSYRRTVLNTALAMDAAAYFQQQHLSWTATRACARSLLLIDHLRGPQLETLPPDLLDRPGALQRVRIVFDPRQCPDCRTDR